MIVTLLADFELFAMRAWLIFGADWRAFGWPGASCGFGGVDCVVVRSRVGAGGRWSATNKRASKPVRFFAEVSGVGGVD